MKINDLLSGHSSTIGNIVHAIRAQILGIFPDCIETLDNQNLGFGFSPGYKQLVFVITPHTNHVNLGIANGASIDDPAGLMEGTGKVHRHVKLRSVEDVTNPALIELTERVLLLSRSRLEQDA